MSRVSLKGAASRVGALVDVRADGAALALDLIPVATPITAQIVNFGSGTCWESRFEGGNVLRNANGEFRARTSS